uniref:DUF4838 domain-containing protein n=1 Tax=uncultured Draconibacterium sp. TaxID=1573823 RepID=UPI003217380B
MRLTLVILLTLFLVKGTLGKEFPIQKLQNGQWLKTWYLIGPFHLQKQKEASGQWQHIPGFETDYLEDLGGEIHPKLSENTAVFYPKGEAKCFLYNSPDSIINLDNALSKEAPVLAYCYTEIEVPDNRVSFLSLGSNDGCRLWLNGEQIWDYPSERGLSPNDDLIPVTLKKGKNTLLLKVEERAGSWGFCVRFLPFLTDNLTGGNSLFSVTSKTDGSIKLHSPYPETVLNMIIKNVEIIIRDSKGKEIVREKRKNQFTDRLNFHSEEYLDYTMSVKSTLNTREIIQQEIPFFAGIRKEYTLFSNKKTDYRIVLSNEASESEIWAAGELQHWINEISGAKLPVKSFDISYTGPQIFVGYNDWIKQKTQAVQPQPYDESFLYFNSGANIVIYGGSKRGTMYGVMSFLEKEMGCRWYTSMVSAAPQKDKYTFERLNHFEKPGIRVRNDFYYEAFDPVWAARNKMNGTLSFDKTRPQHGGTENYWAVHTFYQFMPPKEFYKDHPEYYSLIDGERIYERAQLCLSNPDVLEVVTERLKKTIRVNPDYLIYSVSQNDWRNPCQCEKCQALVKREGSESGPVIWFVNQVAQAIEKEFPDKYVGTLAYQYTRTPPLTIKPRENVVVRLCSIECCFAHDFTSCPENQSFLSDLKGWSAIAPHLYIWDYVVNFSHYIMPYPNFKVLQSNIKTFQRNNAIGIMEQAAYQSRGGEFAELRAYLISKLLWNPDCSVEEVIDDFMYGYYGRAGQYIRAYFDLLHNRLTPKTHIHLGLSSEDILFSENFIREAEAIFCKAEKVAETNTILQRVEMAELPLLYLKCKRTPELSVYDGSYQKFRRIVKREGITHYAETGKKHKDEFHQALESVP